MSNKLFTSCNLCSIPFLGHTDSTRLQMSSKQLNQTLTHQSCEVPKVIGADFRHLTSNSMLFKLDAPCDGMIQYQNDEIMIVLYNHSDGETLKTYETPVVRVCSGLYSTTLRYRRELGSFKKGDILYEYDAFNFGLPTYGYNAWTAYVPFFGFNHEDAVVVSESFCAKAKSTKSQLITIPIYTQTLFKNTYPNSYLGFIPEVGQEIDGNTLLLQSIPDSKHVLRMLKASNVIDFTSIVNNKLYFKPTPIQSRIKNGKVIDIRIHKITKNIMMIDKQLQLVLETEYYNYLEKVKGIIGDLDNLYQNKTFMHETLSSHYMMEGNSVKGTDFNLHNLLYVIEIKLAKESTTHLGDKLANRYANKGIISLVLPDELRPIAMKSKKPIDIMVGPISVIARMNYG